MIIFVRQKHVPQMSFTFKKFHVDDSRCAMKIGTDGVLLGAWVDLEDVRSVVDVGAGSGLVSLMVAQRTTPDTDVAGVEIDEGAAADMAKNFGASPWTNRLTAVCDDYRSFTDTVDLVVSNPPFFSSALRSPDRGRDLARHGGTLGPMELIDYASSVVSPTGSLAMITEYGIRAELTYRAEMAGFKLRRFASVVSRPGREPIRALWQFRRIDGPIERTGIVIRDADGAYSEAYRTLTHDFYIK